MQKNMTIKEHLKSCEIHLNDYRFGKLSKAIKSIYDRFKIGSVGLYYESEEISYPEYFFKSKSVIKTIRKYKKL